MLEQVLRYINNRFDEDQHGRPYGSVAGSFEVAGNTLEVDGLQEGQYFWVEGSVMNDGLHRYPDRNMRDEAFDGTVVFLAVPSAVCDLASEIEAWNESNAKVIDSPYQSESFGGYSYSKASGGAETAQEPWQTRFGARLRPYRKLSRTWV